MIRREITRGEVTLSVLESGSRPDVVLLHGLAGAGAEMVALGEGLDFLAPDQRGHGRSTRRPADLSRAAYVADVLALIDRPVDLVGQSMGAHTAMLVAAARPDLVRRLVMIEGGVGGSTDDYPARLGKWFASWPVPFPDEAAAMEFLGGRSLASAWVADLERRPDGLWPRFDADVMETAIRAVASHARWPEWESLTVPTLIIQGATGTMDPAELTRMRRRPNVDHLLIPDAGHDVHLDTPALCAEAVRSFLDRR